MNKVRWLILICMFLVTQRLAADTFMRGIGSDGSNFDIAQLTDLGADSVRPHIAWRSIEPDLLDASLTVAAVNADPDLVSNYAGDWDATDDLINPLADNGFSIIARIGYGATMYLPSIGESAATPDQLGTEYYLGCVYRHVRAVVRTYKDRIHHWIIEGEQNEAQLAVLFGWRHGAAWSDPTFLTDLTATLHDAVRIEDPSAKIAIAFHTDIHENIHHNLILSLTAGPYSWTEWLEEWEQYLDIVGLDCYPNYYTADPIYGTDVGARVAAAKAIAPGKSVIVLETAYPVPAPGITLPDPVDYTEEKQAQYVGDAVNSAIDNNVDGFFYFSLKSNGMQDVYTQQDLDALATLGPAFHDGDTAALIAFLLVPGNLQYCTEGLVVALQNVESGFGLIRSDNSKRPGFDVLQAVFSGDINRPPSASNLSISPPSPKTQDDLIADYDYFDPDGDTQSGSEVKWYKTGDGVPTLTGAWTLPSSATAKGQEWYFTVAPGDGTTTGALQQSPAVTIVNTSPTASNLTIDPATPVTGDALNGDYDFNDVDGDPDSSVITWYKNGDEQPAYSGARTLPSSATAKGQEWYFTVEPNDGTDSGTLQQLPAVTIGNTPPTASNLTIDPETPVTGDDLTGDYDFNDADGDPNSSVITWYKNGDEQPVYGGVLTVPSSATAEGQEWYFTVEPNDGTASGTLQQSSTVTIGSTPPTASDPSITPSAPLTGDNLEANYTYKDVDGGEQLNSEIRWYKNDERQTAYDDSMTVPSAATSRGETWYFTVRPGDGVYLGDLVTSPTAIIGNTPPTVASASISSDTSPAVETSVLTASADGWSDADGDAEDYRYQWYNQNGAIAGATDPTLDGSLFDRDDEVYCVITPFDGTDEGTSEESNHITINNTLPTVSAVSVTPETPKTTDDLTLNYTYSDVDDDADVGTQIRWYKDSIQQPINDQKTVPFADTAKNQVWSFTLRPYDGTDFGSAVAGSVSIVNTPPVADADGAYSARPNEEVLFDGSGSFDADGDPLTYSWTFGDGDTGSGVAPPHIYTANGIYDVSLEVHDGEVDSDPSTTKAYIYDPAGMQQIVIDLTVDWNLISIYVQPLDDDLEVVLASILDDVEAVWAYDAEAQEWMCRIIDGPTCPNNLDEVVPGMGYWIKMKQPGTLIVQGTEPATAITLQAGLNVVGYSSDVSRAIADCVSSVNCNGVWAYDVDQAAWLHYSPDAPAFLNSLNSMSPGSGYVIDMAAGCVWDISP